MTSPVKGYTNVGFEYSNRHTQIVEKNGGTETTNNIPIFNQHHSNVSTNIEIRAETVEPRFVRRNPESGDLSNDNRYIEILQDYSQVYLMSLGLIINVQYYGIVGFIFDEKYTFYSLRLRASDPNNHRPDLKIQYIMMLFHLLDIPASARAILSTMM